MPLGSLVQKYDPTIVGVDGLLLVRFNASRFALPLSKVQEVVRLGDFAPIPCSPSYVVGLVNLRGGIVTVIDPVSILFPYDGEYRALRQGMIVILEHEGRSIGVLAENVDGVHALSEFESIASIDEQTSGSVAMSIFVSDTMRLGTERVFVINPVALLSNAMHSPEEVL